eukprot:CAMPEP_0197704674 /NCGR_PEP_ID=MMETSP1338-20131121/126060_1 /TAXON_ID=43686 ORGANISM="Pelagodinium beii, Strain RCC1491" /NCGR_SAMPLE_ID=MMETSP1338 /ASSEMBLY_ACC=CAM_ASM_000754 /LENGTH=273 /DNA_ID=CAMNT_0043288577 /DNA_START=72 /DNA_END=893 /DNA_ORIENTATION=+
MMNQQQQYDDHVPKVNAFRSFCLQVTEQICNEFEREVRQMSDDILKYRGELARCADLLAFQLGKEKQYHNMLENIAGNTSALVGKAGEVGQQHGAQADMKRQMQEMLEHMFNNGKGLLGETHSHLEDHRAMAETHLMTSSQLQDQGAAVQKELDNILESLKMPPVSYQQAPLMMGPSQMQGGMPQQQFQGSIQQQQYRPPAGMATMPSGALGNPMMTPAAMQGGASPNRNQLPLSQPGSPAYGGPMAGMAASPGTPGSYKGPGAARMNNINMA